MTTTEAAAWLGVTDRRVRQLLEAKRLRGHKEKIAYRRFRWIVEQTSIEAYDVARRDFEAILHARRVTWAKTQNERREEERLDELAVSEADAPYTR
jgi:hypothetical protein